MRIGLDARTIYRPQRRGTGKNLLDLYRHVARIRPDWRILAYHREPKTSIDLLPVPFVEPKYIEFRGDRFDAWTQLRLPLAAWRDGVDVLHCPANECPRWMPVPTVVTIHDLIPLDRPGITGPRFASSVQRACRGASKIICPSAYTSERLVREFHADRSRILVNPWAADSSVRPVPPAQWPPVLQKYGAVRPFVLHFGAACPRKNTLRLVQAWAMLTPAVRDTWHLVVIGLEDQIRPLLQDAVKSLDVSSSVALNGFAPEQHVPALLSAADVLAYPSLSEGFGLPILDAWAAETAVLAARTSSIPEVAGDAALLVDPTDPCAIAEGLGALLTDQGIRRRLLRHGKRRLKQYDWTQTAERFVKTIESVPRRPGARGLAA